MVGFVGAMMACVDTISVVERVRKVVYELPLFFDQLLQNRLDLLGSVVFCKKPIA